MTRHPAGASARVTAPKDVPTSRKASRKPSPCQGYPPRRRNGGDHIEPRPSETLGTVRNAAGLLRLLSEGDAHQQLSDLASRSGLSLASVHRLLRSLLAFGLVRQDPRSSRYGLGPELVELSERYLARLSVLGVAPPYLAELRDSTRATVLISLLIRGCVVYVDRIDGDETGGVFRETHRIHPATETAAGRALLGVATDEEWAVARERFPDDDLLTERNRRRWAEHRYLVVDPTPTHHDTEVATAICRVPGDPPAALSVVVEPGGWPADAIEERLAPSLMRAAGAIRRTADRA